LHIENKQFGRDSSWVAFEGFAAAGRPGGEKIEDEATQEAREGGGQGASNLKPKRNYR